ncbi:TIGR01212 family radical SAM protein [bacterium]|nr:TIGR01212 family radical SAM protein [bacterium]
MGEKIKRYRDYNSYLRDIFGERVQKISLDAGFNCPNRDGLISRKGCIYCDSRGSGTGALVHNNISIDQQIETGKELARKRYKAGKFIVYFQSFSNTYAPVSRLENLYSQALSHDDVVGISIGTRPDCVDQAILGLINSLSKKSLLWIEFGLQSAHDVTLKRINRGHNVACFDKSVIMAAEYGLNICAHVILGLPGETREMMLDTARHISRLPISGVKIHQLYIVKGTPLETMFRRGEYSCLERDEYAGLVADFLEILPPHFVIQRLTGDPFRSELVAPLWAKDKTENLRLINQKLEWRNSWQGKKYR